jgi:hypothetical protein
VQAHVSAVMNSASSSSPSVQYLNGRCEKSTLAIVSVMIFVPNRSLPCQLLASPQSTVCDNSRLCAELVHHFGSGDTVWEPGEVLDLLCQLRSLFSVREHQLTSVVVVN